MGNRGPPWGNRPHAVLEIRVNRPAEVRANMILIRPHMIWMSGPRGRGDGVDAARGKGMSDFRILFMWMFLCMLLGMAWKAFPHHRHGRPRWGTGGGKKHRTQNDFLTSSTRQDLCWREPLHPRHSMLRRVRYSAFEPENKMQLELLEIGASEHNVDEGG